MQGVTYEGGDALSHLYDEQNDSCLWSEPKKQQMDTHLLNSQVTDFPFSAQTQKRQKPQVYFGLSTPFLTSLYLKSL